MEEVIPPVYPTFEVAKETYLKANENKIDDKNRTEVTEFDKECYKEFEECDDEKLGGIILQYLED